jgi:hypothetical protein
MFPTVYKLNTLKDIRLYFQTAVVALTFSALIIPAIIWALYSTGRFERLLIGTNDNNSAAARVVVYDILNFMTPYEFYWGMHIDRATMLANSFLYIVNFESVEVSFVLSFGLYLTIIFFAINTIVGGGVVWVPISVIRP